MSGQSRAASIAGFNLIELSIVLTIIGILTAVAIPAWQEHLRYARRAGAVAALSTIAARQARYLLEHRRYAQADELFTARPAGLGIPAQLAEHYALEIRPDASGFMAAATIREDAAQRNDTLCYQFTLDATGLKHATSTTGADTTRSCWN